MIYRIVCDREKCSDCGRCEEYWPGVTARFNCQGFFELGEAELEGNWPRLEWVKNLCPEDAIEVRWRRATGEQA